MVGYCVVVMDEVVLPGDDVVPHYKFFLCLWVYMVVCQCVFENYFCF